MMALKIPHACQLEVWLIKLILGVTQLIIGYKPRLPKCSDYTLYAGKLNDTLKIAIW